MNCDDNNDAHILYIVQCTFHIILDHLSHSDDDLLVSISVRSWVAWIMH